MDVVDINSISNVVGFGLVGVSIRQHTQQCNNQSKGNYNSKDRCNIVFTSYPLCQPSCQQSYKTVVKPLEFPTYLSCFDCRKSVYDCEYQSGLNALLQPSFQLIIAYETQRAFYSSSPNGFGGKQCSHVCSQGCPETVFCSEESFHYSQSTVFHLPRVGASSRSGLCTSNHLQST